MKTFSAAIILALSAFSAAQELAPSPTESVGCEPHGDHWHCDGPRVTVPATTATPVIITTSEAVAVPATTTAAVHDDDHDHDHNHDHDHDHDDDHSHDHNDEEDHDHDDHSAGVLPPSPTASIGCEPHGDHWHCEGPAPTTIATVTTSGVVSGTGAPITTSTGPAFTAGAASVQGSVGAAAGVLGLLGVMMVGI
ncbi:hypothetical protein QBC41DRAFT_396708 [Cercophora samala]|uniref:Uncharacterized protein n=1 Tax=Cercophora samala TaxID=330535 RepID=A0AA39Z9X7_9PEZI|nr:hypothetical protein QBC41DRAFT_396708 [Cercophora samala]